MTQDDKSGRAPKVSVVCAWYNRADYIRDTVQSLLDQDYDDYEIVLVNDGSKDPRVAEILAEFSDPRLRVIHQQNTGFVGAIRRAIGETRGEYIAMMGAGDVSLPERLRLQAAVLDANPGYVGLGCSYSNVTVAADGAVLQRDEFRRGVRDITYDYIRARVGSPFTHGEVMYRRAAYEAVGGYRTFFKFTQDLDLWLRMSRLGSFTLCPEILYERRVFQADGIGADLRKYVIQIALAHVAQECAGQREELGYDVIDVFGADAGLVLTPDRDMSRFLAKTAVKYLKAGMDPEARFFATLAGRGQPTALAFFVGLLVRMSKRESLRPLVERVVSRMRIVDTRQVLPIAATRG